jgi:hypothetical protein
LGRAVITFPLLSQVALVFQTAMIFCGGLTVTVTTQLSVPGNCEVDGNDPGNDTGQSTPSPSTPTAATPTSATPTSAATAESECAIAVNAPASVSAATANMTTAERILGRPGLMITKALL